MSVPKKELYRLVDALPEQKIEKVKRYLESILKESKTDPWENLRKNPPIDDEPLTIEDRQAIAEARAARAAGHVHEWEDVKKELGLCDD